MVPLRISTRPGVTGALLTLVMLLLSPVVLWAQPRKSPPFPDIPFDQWIKEGPREQVPWRTRAVLLGLSGHQRLLAHFEVQINIPEILQRPRNGRLLLLVRVTDSSGHVFFNFENADLSEIKVGEKEGKGAALQYYWQAFVLPGEYQVVMALYHGGTGEHSVAEKRLKIPALNKDPLPDAWQNLPSVEFWAPIKASDPDFFFRPDIEGRLNLPLATGRPVRINVLADFAASEIFHGSSAAYSRYLGAALPTLKTFSQIDVRNGSVDVAVLDLARQRVGFHQENLKELDWARMKKTLAENDAGIVSIDALKVKNPGPVLLRDELLRRLNTPEPSSGGPESAPLRVFILMSSPLGLYSFAGLKSDLLPEKCSCVVYYLEYDSSRLPGRFSAIGNVRKMLRPLPVHTFSTHSAMGIRQALAAILKEVASM
jgi:hypothetical protein